MTNTSTATDFYSELIEMIADHGFVPGEDGDGILPDWMAGRYYAAAVTAGGFVAINVTDAEAQSLTIVAMNGNGVIDDVVHVSGGRAIAIAEAVIASFGL